MCSLIDIDFVPSSYECKNFNNKNFYCIVILMKQRKIPYINYYNCWNFYFCLNIKKEKLLWILIILELHIYQMILL